jgi:predicted DCC family thiol-disulfide oxidoreductase YuxK
MRVLLYDGLCGFCNRAVQFVLARDPGGSMMFAPLQGKFAADMLSRRPGLQAVNSLILVDDVSDGGDVRVSVRSEAVLGVARYLGWPWRGALALQVLPRAVRDWGYDHFAHHRHRFFGRYESCPVPSPEARKRFMP